MNILNFVHFLQNILHFIWTADTLGLNTSDFDAEVCGGEDIPKCLEHCQWDGVGFGLIVVIAIGGMGEAIQTTKEITAATMPSIGSWIIGRTIEMPSP